MRRVLAGVASIGTTLLVGGGVWFTMQNQSVRIERDVTVDAPPADVFLFLNDLRERGRWDSWIPSDPDLYLDGSDVVVGAGAWTTWECDAGSGHITVVSSQRDISVVQKVEVWEPMPHQTVTTVSVNAEGRGTQVTYVLEREQDFMGKMVGLIADVETLLGADVDRRLKRLKFEAERAWLHRSEKSSRAKTLMERASRMSQPVPEESAPKDP